MRYEKNFNFKKKLREHVREQHVKKPINCSFLSIATIKSICEIEKNSTVIKAPALQASHVSFTASRIQIVFEVTSSKNSSLSTETSKMICETMKKSTVIDSPASPASQKPDISTATSKQKSESVKTFETIISSKGSHLQSDASEIVSKLMKNTSIHCSSIPSKSLSFQTFESSHQKISVQKLSKFCSLLSINTAKSVCEIQKSSTVIIFKKNCSICRIEVSSIKDHYLESSSCHEALRHKLKQQLARRAHQREHEAQKQTKIEKTIDRPVENSHLSINAVNFVCEIEKTTKSTKKSTTCRRCNQTFDSNNKLHEHIREHHARKPVRSLNLRAPTPGLTYKTIEKPAGIRPRAPLTLQKPPTPPATPRSQISSSETASRSVSSSGWNLPIATHKTTPNPVETASINGLLTPPATPSPMLRKPASKPHLTVDDLFRMFRGNPRPFGLRQHHNRQTSPRSFGLRQPGRPCSTPSKRPHLTIENLFEMFDGKFRRKGLFQGQNNVSSQASPGQMQITAYFKPRANQKPPINQASKGSKSKASKQHTPAESIRTAFSRSLPEKSANLPYKMPDVSCTHLKPPVEASSFISILLRLFPAFLLALALVSAISAVRMSCISAYQQAISAIGRANIGLVASRRS